MKKPRRRTFYGKNYAGLITVDSLVSEVGYPEGIVWDNTFINFTTAVDFVFSETNWFIVVKYLCGAKRVLRAASLDEWSYLKQLVTESGGKYTKAVFDA